MGESKDGRRYKLLLQLQQIGDKVCRRYSRAFWLWTSFSIWSC